MLDWTINHHVHASRLFYLSISPDFYGWVAAAIDQHARPQLPAWLRVVFEKPFGRVGQVVLKPMQFVH
jgi:glucose-6-phosphate 1-dehydrogenase